MPKPSPRSSVHAAVLEGMSEYASRKIQMTVLGAVVDAVPVHCSIEHAGLVAQRAAEQIAEQLHADVPIGNQVGWERLLGELKPCRILQTLQPYRGAGL